MNKVEEVKKVTENAIIVHDTRGQIWMDDKEVEQLNLIIQGKV